MHYLLATCFEPVKCPVLYQSPILHCIYYDDIQFQRLQSGNLFLLIVLCLSNLRQHLPDGLVSKHHRSCILIRNKVHAYNISRGMFSSLEYNIICTDFFLKLYTNQLTVYSGPGLARLPSTVGKSIVHI